jgi:hypothetical protein
MFAVVHSNALHNQGSAPNNQGDEKQNTVAGK